MDNIRIFFILSLSYKLLFGPFSYWHCYFILALLFHIGTGINPHNFGMRLLQVFHYNLFIPFQNETLIKIIFENKTI